MCDLADENSLLKCVVIQDYNINHYNHLVVDLLNMKYRIQCNTNMLAPLCLQTLWLDCMMLHPQHTASS